jgi:hypothetical protein
MVPTAEGGSGRGSPVRRACGGIGRQHDSVMGTRCEGEGLVHVGDNNDGGRRGEVKRRARRLGEQKKEGESEREK